MGAIQLIVFEKTIFEETPGKKLSFKKRYRSVTEHLFPPDFSIKGSFQCALDWIAAIQPVVFEENKFGKKRFPSHKSRYFALNSISVSLAILEKNRLPNEHRMAVIQLLLMENFWKKMQAKKFEFQIQSQANRQ